MNTRVTQPNVSLFCWSPTPQGSVLWLHRRPGIDLHTRTKDSWPGVLQATCHGAIEAGESHIMALKRELQEELQLSARQAQALCNRVSLVGTTTAASGRRTTAYIIRVNTKWIQQLAPRVRRHLIGMPINGLGTIAALPATHPKNKPTPTEVLVTFADTRRLLLKMKRLLGHGHRGSIKL